MAEGFKSDIPPAINQTARKYIRGMMKGKQRWSKLYGKRDREVMHKTANKMAMGEMQKMPPTYNDVFGGINEKAVSKKQQRFFGMVRATQKGEMENPSPEVAKVAATTSVSSVKDFAKTKHKGLPMKKEGMYYKDFIKLVEGNPTARMLSKAKSKTTGNISADRGTDEKKNRESRKNLEKDLKKKGIGYKKGVGEYKYSSGEGTGREVSYQTSPGKGMSKRRFGKIMRRLGRKHGQESVITKKAGKPARLHDTENKKPNKSANVGKAKPGKNPSGMGETSGTKVRKGKLGKTNKAAYHYG